MWFFSSKKTCFCRASIKLWALIMVFILNKFACSIHSQHYIDNLFMVSQTFLNFLWKYKNVKYYKVAQTLAKLLPEWNILCYCFPNQCVSVYTINQPTIIIGVSQSRQTSSFYDVHGSCKKWKLFYSNILILQHRTMYNVTHSRRDVVANVYTYNTNTCA